MNIYTLEIFIIAGPVDGNFIKKNPVTSRTLRYTPYGVNPRDTHADGEGSQAVWEVRLNKPLWGKFLVFT